MQYFRDSSNGAIFAFDDDVSAERVEGGWIFLDVAGNELSNDYPATLEPTDDPTPPPYVPTLEENAFIRDSLLSQAAVRIAPLQDAVDLKVETDDDIAELQEWKAYRVKLNRMDLSVFPVEWPPQPVEA